MQQHPHHHSYDPLHLFEGEDEQQMSEAFRNSAFLALSGGFQDAYTYNVRNEVFSNAQTGNVVLMSQHLMAGEWMSGLRYLLPLISFALGVWVAEKIQGKYRYSRKLHWRQGVLLAEIILLFIVGFVPRELDMLATTLVSFACAMQVQSFRKVHGYSYASTMCIGNLRGGTAAISFLFPRAQAGRSQESFLLLRHHCPFCSGSRSWRKSFHPLWHPDDLGMLRFLIDKFRDVLRKDLEKAKIL